MEFAVRFKQTKPKILRFVSGAFIICLVCNNLFAFSSSGLHKAPQNSCFLFYHDSNRIAKCLTVDVVLDLSF